MEQQFGSIWGNRERGQPRKLGTEQRTEKDQTRSESLNAELLMKEKKEGQTALDQRQQKQRISPVKHGMNIINSRLRYQMKSLGPKSASSTSFLCSEPLMRNMAMNSDRTDDPLGGMSAIYRFS